ncbi:hypothetical protein SEA_ROMAN_122 [Microbacterium phage Roman]|nr:hypothetical protein SEA_ROMAN_6 [Microbacterium phage Roman]QDK03363.1 hypothetical protein SEA_ROMAN_122 [Microbacterium phage Roman]
MFTNAHISRLARHASALIEGGGKGHTEYVHADSKRRYVVGGVVPALIFPIGTARPVIRAAVRRMIDAAQADSMAWDTIGCWEDNGAVYVDLGDTWSTLGPAHYMGRTRGELAIYDTVTGECVPVAPAAPAFGALAR